MKLSKEELQQLIDSYRSELRLLTYQTQKLTKDLKGLEREERTAKSRRKIAPSVPKEAGKRGRPAGKSGKRGRPAGKSKGGYRLNVWDEIVLKTLQGRKKPGVFSDFFSAAKKNPASKGLSQKDLYARINQSLHKLANKRKALKKVEHEGRGFGYQLV